MPNDKKSAEEIAARFTQFNSAEYRILLKALEAYATQEREEQRKGSGCGICGSRMVFIRGRHPHEEEREVCPTCAVERLEQIRDISSPDYGRAFTAKATAILQQEGE